MISKNIKNGDFKEGFYGIGKIVLVFVVTRKFNIIEIN
jgi:hypothetical protein